ncbi:MAG: hypothetical protein FJX76_13975 [Armatimonadetes bacterium]|nr:hypothetical protein [Armatimonadota bacterium]
MSRLLRGLFLAFVGVIVLAAAPACADDVSYYSVSLIHPKTHRLDPIVVYYNGKFMLSRRVKIPYGASFYVKARATKGRYLSVIFRDDSSRLYDLPLEQRLMKTDVKEFVWTMPRRFMPGNVEFYVCLWTGYNTETLFMEGALYKSQFLTLGTTSI